jgi:hypothetical protein
MKQDESAESVTIWEDADSNSGARSRRSRVLCAVVDRVAKPERTGTTNELGTHGSKRLAHCNARQGRNRR